MYTKAIALLASFLILISSMLSTAAYADGLCQDCPWPKSRHDNHNSGTSETSVVDCYGGPTWDTPSCQEDEWSPVTVLNDTYGSHRRGFAPNDPYDLFNEADRSTELYKTFPNEADNKVFPDGGCTIASDGTIYFGTYGAHRDTKCIKIQVQTDSGLKNVQARVWNDEALAVGGTWNGDEITAITGACSSEFLVLDSAEAGTYRYNWGDGGSHLYAIEDCYGEPGCPRSGFKLAHRDNNGIKGGFPACKRLSPEECNMEETPRDIGAIEFSGGVIIDREGYAEAKPAMLLETRRKTGTAEQTSSTTEDRKKEEEKMQITRKGIATSLLAATLFTSPAGAGADGLCKDCAWPKLRHDNYNSGISPTLVADCYGEYQKPGKDCADGAWSPVTLLNDVYDTHRRGYAPNDPNDRYVHDDVSTEFEKTFPNEGDARVFPLAGVTIGKEGDLYYGTYGSHRSLKNIPVKVDPPQWWLPNYWATGTFWNDEEIVGDRSMEWSGKPIVAVGNGAGAGAYTYDFGDGGSHLYAIKDCRGEAGCPQSGFNLLHDANPETKGGFPSCKRNSALECWMDNVPTDSGAIEFSAGVLIDRGEDMEILLGDALAGPVYLRGLKDMGPQGGIQLAWYYQHEDANSQGAETVGGPIGDDLPDQGRGGQLGTDGPRQLEHPLYGSARPAVRRAGTGRRF